MRITAGAFYTDWTFWTAVMSTVAVVLSQLPPVLVMFRRSKLDLEIYSRAHITHKVGNPYVQLHVVIGNIGGWDVRIKGVALEIYRDKNLIATLPAQNYLQYPQDNAQILLTRFTLKPREEWSHIVNFLNFLTRDEEKAYRAAESALKFELSSKRGAQTCEAIIEAKTKLVDPFLELFAEKFIWVPGEYEMLVSVDAEPDSTSIFRKYRFTVFESDSRELQEYSEGFKFGAGIYWDNLKHAGVVVTLTEE